MQGVRFGIFDFSPSTGELWRDGVPVRLQAQPARVLAALVARPGALVTRETLQREIWGEGTHVDFERGLNFCITQVRGALADSAESPRFIETVPKQGYRFVAPVRRIGSASDRAEIPAELHADPSQSTVKVRSEPVLRTRAWPRTAAIGSTAGAILIAAALLWARVSSAAAAIVVIPFYNETGRPDHDLLARAVGDATVARLATEDRAAAIGVIGNAAALRNPFARQDVQQIAHDLDAEWVLIGQLKTDGAGLRVIAHLIRVSDMKHLWAHTYDDPAFAFDAQTRTAEAIAAAVTASLARPD